MHPLITFNLLKDLKKPYFNKFTLAEAIIYLSFQNLLIYYICI